MNKSKYITFSWARRGLAEAEEQTNENGIQRTKAKENTHRKHEENRTRTTENKPKNRLRF